MKKRIIIVSIIIVLLVIVGIITAILLEKKDNLDTITYQGKKYVYLECNRDIFCYYYHGNIEYEEDKIYPIEHKKWDMIYCSGDLFVLDNQVKEATLYYTKDSNYKWKFVLDVDDEEKEYSIPITDKEIKYLIKMDDIKKEKAIVFDDIEKMGSLIKISKDNTIIGTTSLAFYKENWYWRTEIIDDSKEETPEYIIKLPNSVNKKINKIIKK